MSKMLNALSLCLFCLHRRGVASCTVVGLAAAKAICSQQAPDKRPPTPIKCRWPYPHGAETWRTAVGVSREADDPRLQRDWEPMLMEPLLARVRAQQHLLAALT